MEIKVKVIEAGAIPLTVWSNSGAWKLAKGQGDPDELPPRVLLEVSEAGARALAAHLYDEVIISVPDRAQEPRL